MATVREISRELLASEARNLHAIQKNAKAMMLKVIDRLDHYPDAKARLVAHLGDKEREMGRLEQVLSELDQEPSAGKDVSMSLLGGLTGLMTGALEDDVLTTSRATFALASYEICAYEAMIGLAAHAEAPAVAPLLQECLDEERAMADWLHDHMSPTLERYLALRSAGGEQAAAH